MFSGVFMWQNNEFTDVFRHSAWVFSCFLGQRTTRKCREKACSPTFTHRLMRCFPSFQKYFLQENAPFSLFECAYFRAFSTFPEWFYAENVINLAFIHWFTGVFVRNLTFVVAVLFFPAPTNTDTSILSPISLNRNKETRNEKLSMHFWTLLLWATQTITYKIKVHNNIVYSTECL